MADQTPDAPTVDNKTTPEIDVTEIATSVKQDVLSEIEAKFPEMTENLSNKVKQDIINRITGDKPKEKWHPKDYEEIVDKAVSKFEDVLKQRDEETSKKQAKVQEDTQKTQAEWNKYWDAQLADLEKEGILLALPKEIAEKMADGKQLTDKEKDDPSIKARMALYTKSKELKDEGYRDWYNLELIHHKYMAQVKSNPARNAPVLTRGVGVVSKQNEGEYSHNYIRSRSMAQIMKDSVKDK